jgi:hypothetical protein
MEFQVKPKGAAKPIVWNTRGSVRESGLLKFGSSIPGDDRSKPAASLTYNTMWYLPEHKSLVVMINTRSQIGPTQTLFERIRARNVPAHTQLWELSAVSEKGAEGPYFNIAYRAAGYPPQEVWEHTAKLAEMYRVADYEPQGGLEKDGVAGGNTMYNEEMASKF